MFPVKEKLIFVMGKGGTGRSTVAASLSCHFARKQEKVLLVQWSLTDAMEDFFKVPSAHKAREVAPNIYSMNFSFDLALQEYFVEHLQANKIFKYVISTSHMQKLLQGMPGIQELFFLGRLFWVMELSSQLGKIQYDRIIVDSPATGHGISLFSLPRTIASIGIAGPIAFECERVANFLDNKDKVGAIFVTLPEEMPAEETYELNARFAAVAKRKPIGICINRTMGEVADVELDFSSKKPKWALAFEEHCKNPTTRNQVDNLLSLLLHRKNLEEKLAQRFAENGISTFTIPDIILHDAQATPEIIMNKIAGQFARAREGSS